MIALTKEKINKQSSKLKMKILVFDDDQINRRILSRYLEDYGDVVVVDCGEEAINKCKSDFFDLVLLDIRSKDGMDGVKALKKIKEIDRYKDIPVLAITGYAMNRDKEYFLQEGFNGYLAKPFLKDTFIEFIKNYLPI